MPRLKYDFVVIGGGSAGFNAARVASEQGRSVAVIDGAKELGGLCILRGCMPSKTLIYAAEVLHLARTAKDFGLSIPRASANMRSVQDRKRKIIDDFAKFRVKQLQKGNWDLIRSRARFTDPKTVVLDDGTEVHGTHFLIATGSKVSVPPVKGLATTPFWISDDVLDLENIPKSVIMLGGGVVSCELSQFLRRFGTRVCVVQRGTMLLRKNSRKASAVVRAAFEDEGIEVLTGTKILDIKASRKGVRVTFGHKGKLIHRQAERLVNALGREPNTSGLCLDCAGVKTKSDGRIITNRWQQTSSRHIYAAGDCSGPHEIVHVAVQQGELAARHSGHSKGIDRPRPVSEGLLLSVVFTDPQVAAIGWSEQALVENGVEYEAASYPFNDHGKSILMNAGYGYVKVMAAARSGRILGAEIVGVDAGEMIHCFSTPLAMRATVFDMLKAPWFHPTLSEIVTYPLEEIAGRLTHKSSSNKGYF